MNKFKPTKFQFLIIFIFSYFTNLNAQKADSLDDLIEQTSDGKFKIYLDGVFRISYKDCSQYYLIADLDDNIFHFKDSLKIFYKEGDLFLTGSYQKGKLHGKFKTYYRDGIKEMDFEYNSGNRSGTWENFSKQGESIKKVIYNNNSEFLLEQQDKQGKNIVKNGNGKFVDNLYMSISNSRKSKLTGSVKNGLPDREWKFYTENVNYAKEYFKNYTFEKGISISPILGNEYYYNNFSATFTGIIFIEQLKIIGPSICKQKSTIGVNDEFYNKIKQQFYQLKLNELINNSWFYVEIETGNNKKIVDVKIISNADNESINLIKELIYSLKKADTFPFKYKPGFDYFPIVIKNSKIYTPYDKEIELLNYKY